MTSFQETPAGLDTRRLASLLRTRELGREVEWHEVLESSNDVALERARAGAPHGLLVGAEAMTAARGRYGRHWEAQRGQGLWTSLLLRRNGDAGGIALLPLVVGLGLHDALSRELQVSDVFLRWPNDLDLKGRKLSGILCERSPMPGGEVIVVGLGINVRRGAVPADLARRATSLEAEGYDLDRELLLAAVLLGVERRLDQWHEEGFAGLRGDYLSALQLLGHEIRVSSAGQKIRGILHTVDVDGSLVLRIQDSLRLFQAGDVGRVR